MIERLGNVLYWASCIVAVAVTGFFLIAALDVGFSWEGTMYAVLIIAVCWLVGRALRYILAGR